MTKLRNVILASGLLLACATPALAQEGMVERGFVYVAMDGKMTKMTANDAQHAMMMKMGKPVKAGTIFYMSGGKLYMAQDTKTSGGSMTWDLMRNSNPNTK